MIQTLKMTSKRQATFPARVCEDLGVGPGQEIFLERRDIDGRPAWLLAAKSGMVNAWFGALHRYAAGKPHDMASVRRSVAKKAWKDRA